MIDDSELQQLCQSYNIELEDQISPSSSLSLATDFMESHYPFDRLPYYNSYGERFSVAFRYSKSPEMNAICLPVKRNEFGLIVNLGLFISIQEIAYSLLAKPDIYESIFGRKRPESAPEYSWQGPLGLNWLSSNSSEELSAFVTGLAKDQNDIVKEVSLLVTLMLIFVFHHEMIHALYGHLGILEHSPELKSIDELNIKKVTGITNKYLQVAELEADAQSTVYMNGNLSLDWLEKSYPEICPDRRTSTKLMVLAPTLVCTLFAHLDKSVAYGDSVINDWGTHPPGILRANGPLKLMYGLMSDKIQDQKDVSNEELEALADLRQLYAIMGTHFDSYKYLNFFRPEDYDDKIEEYVEENLSSLIDSEFHKLTSAYRFDYVKE